MKAAWETYLSAIGVSTLAAASRSVLSEDRRSWKGFTRGLILAIFGSYIIGQALQDQLASHAISEGSYHALVGITGFIADDLFMLLLKIMKIITDNPRKVLDMFLDWLTTFRSKD
jgi:hypothetical protein